jgi:hypothetical protein
VPDISTTLAGFRSLAEGFVPLLLTGISLFLGLLFVFLALKKVWVMGEHRHGGAQASWGAVAGQLLVGGMLLRMAASMQDVSQLLFGTGVQDIRGVMAYAPMAAQAGFWSTVMEVCLLWVVMLGWCGFLKGMLLANRAVTGGDHGNTGDYYWQSFWHVIGGAAAVNLTGALQAFFGK